ncbi:MAG: hypothetical protein RLY34_785 [Actinomycetota bacterium]|jgi:hypothetical protein
MLNISQLRLQLAEDGVQATSVARAELTTRVAEYKDLGDEARAIVFGSHRKAQAAIVPIDMFHQLLDMAEGVVTTPKLAPAKQKVRGIKETSTFEESVQNSESDANEPVEQPKQLAASNLHIGASTQELLDEIMSKWKL